MDSLQSLNTSIAKIENNEFLDHDAKIIHKFDLLKYFARDILKLSENIEETSLNYAHKIERKYKLLNQILNQ